MLDIYLQAARALIANPEYWTQGCHAIANTGAEVPVDDPEAYAFCADGALLKAILDLGRPAPHNSPEYASCSARLNSAARKMFPGIVGITDINDGNAGEPDDTHANVLAVFDAALSEKES